jgi:hypothetical protein
LDTKRDRSSSTAEKGRPTSKSITKACPIEPTQKLWNRRAAEIERARVPL